MKKIIIFVLFAVLSQLLTFYFFWLGGWNMSLNPDLAWASAIAFFFSFFASGMVTAGLD